MTLGAKLPPHRTSTAHLRAAYPFICQGGLGGRGAYIGREVFGGAFCYDPFVLYGSRVISNPNMLVAGQVGRGKSAFVKAYLWRQQVFGRRAWVIDPKGEYARLAEFCSVRPLRIGPGSPIRLNPLDEGPGGRELPGEEVLRRRVTMVSSLAAARLPRPLTPAEHSALDLAVRAASRRYSTPTLPAVVQALLSPEEAAAAEIATTAEGLAEAGRDVALLLRRLCHGDLAGMFDGPTTADIDLDADLVVLDLQAVYKSAALSLLMLCATTWLHASLTRADDAKRMIVVDEAWLILQEKATARWLEESYRLCRTYGVSNIAVIHRLDDLQVLGGSGANASPGHVVADSETQVFFQQPDNVVKASRQLIDLTDAEAELLKRLTTGESLWRVGDRRFHVQHVLGSVERDMVDSDARMR